MKRYMPLLFLLFLIAIPADAKIVFGYFSPKANDVNVYYTTGDYASVTVSGEIHVENSPSIYFTLDSVEYYVDGNLVAKDTFGSYGFTFSFSRTLNIPLGLHFVKVRAVSPDAGEGVITFYADVQSGIQKSCTVYYEGVPVTMTLEVPRDGGTIRLYSGQKMGLYGHINVGKSIKKTSSVTVSVNIDGNNIGSWNSPTVLGLDMYSAAFTISTDISPGTHKANVTMQSAWGSCNVTATFTVEKVSAQSYPMITSQNMIVGAPGVWCKLLAGYSYACDDKTGVIAYEISDDGKAVPISRNDPRVQNSPAVVTAIQYLPPVCDEWGCYNPCNYNGCVYKQVISMDSQGRTENVRIEIYPANPDPKFSNSQEAGYSTVQIPMTLKAWVLNSWYTPKVTVVRIINLGTGAVDADVTGLPDGRSGPPSTVTTYETTFYVTPSRNGYLVVVYYTYYGSTYWVEGKISSATRSEQSLPRILPSSVILQISGSQVYEPVSLTLSNGASVSIPVKSSVCKYKTTATLPDGTAVQCCLPSNEPVTLLRNQFQALLTDLPGASGYTRGIYCLNYACLSLSPFAAEQIVIPVSHPANPQHWTSVTATIQAWGIQPPYYPITGTYNEPFLFTPNTSIPLLQAVLPVQARYGVSYPYEYNPKRSDNVIIGWVSDNLAVCRPDKFRIDGQVYSYPLTCDKGFLAAIANPVPNQPGATASKNVKIEYLTVEGNVFERQNTKAEFTKSISAQRGYAFVEGSKFTLDFEVNTSSRITSAYMLKGGDRVEGQIVDPMKLVRFSWTGKSSDETWQVTVCNEQGKCNTSSVTILGSPPVTMDSPPCSESTPTIGDLVVYISYPPNNAVIPPGTLKATAEAYTNGARITEVFLVITTSDGETICSTTRSSPDSGNTYSITCNLNEGSYTFAAYAHDSLGRSKSDRVSFTVGSGTGSSSGGSGGGGSGSQPPTITQFSYPMYCINDGSSVTVTFSASAPNGLKEARLYADGQLATSKSLSGTSANNVQMTFRAVFNGKQSITIRLVVEDTAGLTAEASGLLVACSRCPDQPPVVNIIEPSRDEYRIEEGDTYQLPVTVGYSDDSAVKRLDLYINNQYYFGIDLDSRSGTVAISPDIVRIELPQGNYTLKAVVKDSCNQATEAVKTVKIKKEEERINLVWTFKKYSDSLAYTNKGPINYLFREYYSVGDMQMSLPSRSPPTDASTVLSCNYEGTCVVYLKPTASLGNSQPSGDGNIILGWYNPSRKLVHFDGPCAVDMAGSNVIYNIYKGLNYDYKYEFKAGCCRYECVLESRLGGTEANCVKIC
jgi:hypothetical protein